VSADVTCPDCGAIAAVTFEPRALRVCFTCPEGAEHGYFRLRGEDDEPLRTWNRGELGYIAIALVAPILAGDDDTWNQVYGTRAADYRATTDALAAFDAAHPEPMRLTPDIRCGECGNAMNPYTTTFPGDGRKSYYERGTRHPDGRYGRFEKDEVDAAIDGALLRLSAGPLVHHGRVGLHHSRPPGRGHQPRHARLPRHSLRNPVPGRPP
jgi:hypothetical protein